VTRLWQASVVSSRCHHENVYLWYSTHTGSLLGKARLADRTRTFTLRCRTAHRNEPSGEAFEATILEIERTGLDVG
jgi:hypothetical protein